MALRKPSDLFGKKDTTGVFQNSEVSSDIVESYDKFRDNFDKVNELSEKVELLSQQLSEKLSRTDLENAMLSQLMVLDENFKSIQSQVKGLNKEDLKEFKTTVNNIAEIVENIVENDLPKYKKQITKSEFVVNEQVNNIKDNIEENISNIREEIDIKFDNIAEVVDSNIEYFNQKLEETSFQVKETKKVYGNLSKILENKLSGENEKFKEYSNLIENLSRTFNQLSKVLKEELSISQQIIEEKFETYKEEVNDTQSQLKNFIDTSLETYREELVDVRADVVINEQHIKNVDEYIKENYSQIIDLREEVFSEIEKLPVGNLQENLERLEKKIDYIRETYSRIEPEVVVKEVIKEGLLNEPPETKNSDPLTPLNQNYVTLDQLQEHYRLFINRIQQQLSTLGGGGETRLKYLDDVVGIATNASAYDGKFLKYDHNIGKFVFETISGGFGSQGIQGLQGDVGIQGLQGTQGLQGSSGYVGSDGPQGSQGTQGSIGPQGIQGESIQGIIGSQGLQGTQGESIQGVQGDVGLQGLQGTQGDIGTQGTQGLQGLQGDVGLQGLQGTEGSQGLQGLRGDVGLQGLQGTQGDIGTQGTEGSQGLQGLQGTEGSQGLQGSPSTTLGYYGSFYDVTNQVSLGATFKNVVAIGQTSEAYGVSIVDGTKITVDNTAVYNIQFSFQLQKTNASNDTVDIWISKNGSDIPYTDSQITIQGSEEKAIPSWNFVLSLNAGEYIEFYWTSSDPNMSLTTLPSGSNPTRPISPSVITTITQVASALSGGGSGNGSQGTQGLQGSAGYIGADGSQGIQGLQGLQGSEGPQGTQGLQGIQGLQGTQGIQGLQGTQGIQGSQGTQGLQGLQGLSNQGVQGTSGATILSSNNTFSGITTFSGNVVSTGVFQVEQVEETYTTYSTSISSGAVVSLDCSSGNIFYITSTVNGNWTANLTNLNLSANCLTNVTLLITQGATAYIPTALQIGGVSQTINWQGGSQPSGNNSKKDAMAFTVFYTGSAYNVFGQLVTFG